MSTTVYPTTLPDKIYAGDSLLLEITDSTFNASNYTAKIVLINSSYKYTGSATASGSSHRFNITPTTTAAWQTGDFEYTIYMEKTGERQTWSSGRIKILADPVASATADNRSFPRKIADALEDIIENRATAEQLLLVSQSIDDLNVNYLPDVLKEWSKWKSYADQAESGSQPSQLKRPTAMYARFT